MFIIDTQLLVLLVVGLTSKKIIAKHKNLTAYSGAHYDLLIGIIEAQPRILLLPNIVSEASNLLRQHRNPERSLIMEKFRELIAECEEHYVESHVAASQPEYLRVGITDSAIVASSGRSIHILTADLDLFVAAEMRGIQATNFNHLREMHGL